MELGRLIRDLGESASWPGAPEVEVIQTHASVVFLVGEEVFKIKKPVDLGFLDYSTIDKRKACCEAEVRLNRRLAPSVYLGVVPVVERDGAARVGEEGTPVDWAVHMRRLPEAATALEHLQRGELDATRLQAVARCVADFHARAARGPEVSAPGRFETVAFNCRENFETLESMVPDIASPRVFERLRVLTEAALEEHEALIERRAREGVVCDTHGDLRLDHVYFLADEAGEEQVVVVDCIEFNDRFRYADPVADVAFFAMDLQAAGAWALAEIFVDAYFLADGDMAGRDLLPLYLGYRATVRAKVEGLRAGESEVPEPERERSRRRGRGRALLALTELSDAEDRPALILVGGLPGTGKSTVARALAQRGFTWLRADEVRKELAGIDPLDHEGPPELYSSEMSDRTYAALRERAKAVLLEGGRVVVDATFVRKSRRTPLAHLGRAACVRSVLLWCEAPAEVVRPRLEARTNDPSDADFSVYELLASRLDEPSADEMAVHEIDATQTPDDMAEQARAALDELGL